MFRLKILSNIKVDGRYWNTFLLKNLKNGIHALLEHVPTKKSRKGYPIALLWENSRNLYHQAIRGKKMHEPRKIQQK